MKKSLVLLLGILPFFLGGCATTMGRNETGGTIVGGVTGALVGSQFGGGTGRVVGAALGTLGGAFVGNQVGKHMDKSDSR